MKMFSKKFLTLLPISLLLSVGVQAQETVISSFPYVSDFGTSENPGQHNAYWKFKAFDMEQDFAPVSSTQWSFSVPSSENGLAVCLNKDARTTEDQAAAFSPQFQMEKKSNVRYIVSVAFSVENGELFSGETLAVRLHATDADGNPYFVNNDGGVYYDSETPISDGEVVKSTFLYNHNGVPGSGSSYTYSIPSEKIPADGNYRISFIIVHQGKKAAKADAKLYITGFELKEEIGVDLAAGQILSPYTDVQASVQPFSAYVINNSSSEIDGFSAYYQVDAKTPVKQEFTNKVNAGSTQKISFNVYPELEQGSHRLKFWVEAEYDNDPSNDTVECFVNSGSQALAGLPVQYGFTEETASGWTKRSDSLYTSPQWHFAKEDNGLYPRIFLKREGERSNNDYLVTPPMSFSKDSMYRIEFTYRAVLEEEQAMGDLSLALYVCRNAGQEAVFSSSRDLLWKKDRFDDKGDRRMVVYYRALENASRVLAFHAYGPSADGGLLLKSLSVAKAEPNAMDYFFDFDGTSGEEPQYIVGRNVDFVDQDGNVSSTGEPGNWELDGQGNGFNSTYSVRSTGIRAKQNMEKTPADDWMVFRPFYLESGKPYYLSFQRKMASNVSGTVEYYIQNNGIRYDLDYDLQPGVKGRKSVSGNNYDTVRRVFEVEENGYYLLAIRNVTEVGEIDDNLAGNYTVYVDNVSLSAVERTAVQAIDAEIPFEARLGRTVSLRMTVRNFSISPVEPDRLNYCYQVGNGAVCREHPEYQLAAQIRSTHTFRQQAVFDKESDQTVKFWVETEGTGEKPDTVRMRVDKIELKDLPFVEKFGENSMNEWQTYPSTHRVWQMQYGQGTAHSGEWAAKCEAVSEAVSDFLVSPMLNVEKGKTYRISFFYKRAGNVGTNDSLSLYYAYNRYDNTGFRNRIAAFPQEAEAEYGYYETYTRFPDSGALFIGLKADMAAYTSALYVDDFVVVDSTQTNITYYTLSNLTVSGEMSECDTTPMGKVSFKVTAGGFSMPSTIPLYVCYNNGPVQDVSLHKEMMDGEEAVLSFQMPMFSGGNHTVKAWIGLPREADRSDDTVSTVFSVHSPKPLPFAQSGIRVVGAPQKTSCFQIDNEGKYKVRCIYDASQAQGAALQLNLLVYGQNSIEKTVPVENITLSGNQTFEKEIEITELGVYAMGFSCSGLPTGGLLAIDSICLEKVYDTTSINRGFSALEFRLQPNPAGDFVEIVLPQTARELAVFDMQGHVCRHLTLRGQEKINLSLQDLRPGVYMVRVVGTDRSATLKLIKH